MSANDDFPRGWSYSVSQNQAGAASIIVPAVTGVAHVLDSFDAKLTIFSAAAAVSFSVFVTVFDGAAVRLQELLICGLPAGGAGTATAVDEWNWSGRLAGIPNNTMTVNFNVAAIASVIENLSITGHDI